MTEVVELAARLGLEIGSLEEGVPLYGRIYQTLPEAEISIVQGGRVLVRRQCTGLLLLRDLI